MTDSSGSSGSSGVKASRTVLFVFVGAHVINDFYATVLPAFLPSVAEEFDLDYTELGILSLAFSLFTGILQPMLGNFADRRGKHKQVVVGGFIAAAIGFLAMASSPTFWFIVLMSLLCGLGAATYHPQATSFIVQSYPEERGRMLGIHGLGGSAGHFLAPAVTVLAVAVLDWRLTMVAIAVPAFVTASVLGNKLETTRANEDASLRGAISRELMLVAVTFGVLGIIGRSFLTFMVKMLVDEGWRETDAGIVLTVILLVGAVAQPLGGRLYDRLGGRLVMTSAATGMAAFVAMFAVTDGALALMALAGMEFFAFAVFPVGLALASKLGAGQTGAAAGVVFGVSGLMTAACQPLVGALGESLGDIREALGWLFPVALVAVLLASRLEKASPETGR